ncbi:hypothetical protein [Rhizobium terrae]|uniref:hypothetical protein n=1 Tax=Rhizobium terrae TaxID=2171756 RepID=UPI0013C2ECA4|nr:hypothetical protein [Rhizobium terrae]
MNFHLSPISVWLVCVVILTEEALYMNVFDVFLREKTWSHPVGICKGGLQAAVSGSKAVTGPLLFSLQPKAYQFELR